MVLSLPPQLESDLAEQARQRGVTPEVLAMNVLCQQLARTA